MHSRVENLIQSFCEYVPGAQWHIAHTELEDYNLEDDYLHSAIEGMTAFLSETPLPSEHPAFHRLKIMRDAVEAGTITRIDILKTRAFLHFLLSIPEAERTVDYDE